MKKRLSVLLASAFAAVLALVMAVPAYAASGDNTITINSETSGHTFEAYQIFAGEYAVVDGTGTLSNVTWGDGVTNGDALLVALQDDTTIGDYFKDDKTAADVAKTLATATVPDSNPVQKAFENNAANIDAFANVVSKYLSTTHSDSEESGAGPYTYTIGNVADGYYFIKDKDNSLVDDEGDPLEGNAYTKFMLQVVADVTVEAKADAPSIEKTTGEVGAEDPDQIDLTGNNASIGDKIPYKVTSAVPDMDGYEKYFFVVTDTMTDGLTFNDDVAITIGDKTLVKNTDYTVTQNGQTFEIVFKNFIQYKDQEGAEIVITYSATLNQDALIGNMGNENKVYLTYSNNPNTDYTADPGNPDKPGPNDPVGTTPESKTYTYTTGINLFKVDENGNALTGAKFSISGTRVKTVLVNSEIFTEDADGEYWRLKNGEYTTKAPTVTGDETDNSDAYESTTQRYTKVTEVTQQNVSEPVELEGWVDNTGHITFDGLAEGEYTIHEMVAPDGYNLLDQDIVIKIDWNAPDVLGEECTWSVNKEGSNDLGDQATVTEDGTIAITVENERGSLLPSTGGMGTTMFYVVGGVLVAGAAVAYVVKRRMSANNA